MKTGTGHDARVSAGMKGHSFIPGTWMKAIATRQVDVPALLVFVLLLGLAVRVIALIGYADLPYFHHYRIDAKIYHDMAISISKGDLLGGDRVLRQSPLYFYFLGLVYWLFGPGAWAPRILQLGMGLGTIFLIFKTSKQLYGPRAALGSAAVAAFYGPFIFYEEQILATSLSVFLFSLLLWVVIRATSKSIATGLKDNPFRHWLLPGVMCGLCTLSRPNTLLLVIPIALAAFLSTRTHGTVRALGCIACVCLSTAVMILPLLGRNTYLGEPVLLTDHGGLNFFVGNGPDANGSFNTPRELPSTANPETQRIYFHAAAETALGRKLTSKESDGYWYQRTFETIIDDPARWMELLVEKFWLFWNARELPNTYDYTFTRHLNPSLYLGFVQFGWLSVLAFWGTIMMLSSRKPEKIFVGGAVLISCAALVLFFVTSRYRLPSIPAIIVAATGATDRIVALILMNKRRWAALYVALALSALPLVYWPKLPTNYAVEYFQLGFAYHSLKQIKEAEERYKQALEIEPELISAHNNLAMLFQRSGRNQLAQSQWQHVWRIAGKNGLSDYRKLAEANLRILNNGTSDTPRMPGW